MHLTEGYEEHTGQASVLHLPRMHLPVAARLAGGGGLKIAPAGKPCCYGGSGAAPVGVSLLAMRAVHPTHLHRMYRPFAGKRAPMVPGMPENRDSPHDCRSALARDGVVSDTPSVDDPPQSRASALLRFRGCRKIGIHRMIVGARLPATASCQTPHPSMTHRNREQAHSYRDVVRTVICRESDCATQTGSGDTPLPRCGAGAKVRYRATRQSVRPTAAR